MTPDEVRLPAKSESLPDVEELVASVSGDDFAEWYRKREFRDNIRNGTPFFNGPSRVPDVGRHSPSKLLQCHRKILYRQQNAPEETTDPTGIFWFGSQFEEELALPFLQEAVTGDQTFATNSIWVDYTVDTKAGEIHIKGETDPVIVDADGVPLLPTEIKTKSSLSHVTSPNQHHEAQLHAYLYGLSQKYDRQVTDGVLLYAAREDLEVKRFHITFDPHFWGAT
ncbi:MAG: Dna2/Cas4 domain-containing protein, partial [Halobacteriaceae archaeon]